MTTQKQVRSTEEALKLALESLEDRVSLMKWQIARDAVKEALAQPAVPKGHEQEPCRHRIADIRNEAIKSGYMCMDCGALFGAYTTPPQPKEQKQTPVAQWQKRHPDETYGLWQDTDAADATWWAAQKTNHGWEVQEVYTTPPPVTESHKRKPLTDEQIQTAARNGQHHHSDFRSGVQFAEAAHGIK